MKKNWFYILLSVAIAAVPLTSCDDDDDAPKTPEEEQYDPMSDADQSPIEAYDALSWLQGSLVVVDSNNEVIRRIYGKPLDESQPTVLSAPVAGYGTAERIFLSWVAPGKEATKVEGGYDYHLTDAEGAAQGCAKFRAVEGEAGVVARMTVTDETALKQVSMVNFIDTDSWPENVTVPMYITGQIYHLNSYRLEWSQDGFDRPYLNKPELSSLPFYCIQGNVDHEEAILVWLCPDDDNKLHHPYLVAYLDGLIGKYQYAATNYLPTEPEAQKVLDFYNKNQAFWKDMLVEMDERGYQWSPAKGFWDNFNATTGNSEFVLGVKERLTPSADYLKILDLDDHVGKICEVNATDFFTPRYRYMQIHIVPSVGK